MCFTIEVYSWKRLHIITVILYPNFGYMDGERDMGPIRASHLQYMMVQRGKKRVEMEVIAVLNRKG